MSKLVALITGVASLCAIATAPLALAGTKTVNGVDVRDWQAIDSNKDHSISPEEIEKFLQEEWSKKGKK